MGTILGILPGQVAGKDGHQAVADGFAELGWEVLQLGGGASAALPPVEVDFALAHSRYGVALVDVMDAHPRPVERMRDRLDAIGFPEIFPGHLPVIHLVLGINDLWRLPLVLDPRFAFEPPMGIAGSDWIALVQRALLLEAAPIPTPARSLPEAFALRAAEPPTEAQHDLPREAPTIQDEPAPEVEPASHAAAEVSSPDEGPPPRQSATTTAAPWYEDEPAREPEAAPAPGRRRHGLWLLAAAAVAAGIGLSHHFNLPEPWMARLLSLRLAEAGNMPEPASSGALGRSAEATAAASPVGTVGPVGAARAVEPSTADSLPTQAAAADFLDDMEPLPEGETLLLDIFRPDAEPSRPPLQEVRVAAAPVPRGAPPEPQLRRAALPPLEAVELLAPQLVASQPNPEEARAGILVAEAPRAMLLEPLAMADAGQAASPGLAPALRSPDLATSPIEVGAAPAATQPEPPASNLPIEAERAPLVESEAPVTASEPPAAAPAPPMVAPDPPVAASEPLRVPPEPSVPTSAPLAAPSAPSVVTSEPPAATSVPPMARSVPPMPPPAPPATTSISPAAPSASSGVTSEPPAATSIPPIAPSVPPMPPPAPPPTASIPPAAPTVPSVVASDPAAATSAPPVATPPTTAVSERPAAPAPATESASAAAAPEAPAATPPRPPAQPSLPPAVIAMLIARGDEMMARGDISGARLLYARAATAGSSAAARAMARSFEPELLNLLGARGIRPDPEQARYWHRMAEEAR